MDQGQYKYAKKKLNRAATILDNLDGVSGKKESNLNFFRANIYAHLGQPDSSTIFLDREMLSTDDDSAGRINLESRYNQIADIHRENGKFGESASLLENVISMARSRNVSEEKLLSDYNNLGYSYRAMGDFDRAREVYETARRITEETHGLNHQNTWIVLNNLASVYSELGETAKAVEIMSRKRLSEIEDLGEMHWKVGRTNSAIAAAYMQNDQFQESQRYYEQAIQIYSQTLGSDHFWTNRSRLRKAVAEAAAKGGNHESSTILFQTSLAGIRKNLDAPLAYYDRKSLDAIEKLCQAHDLNDFRRELREFVSWHDTSF